MNSPDAKVPHPWGRLFEPALAAEDASSLRAILVEDLRTRAWVKDNLKQPFNPLEPFIVYTPMNRRPEMGVATLIGRLAELELQLGEGDGLLLVGAPESATWMAQDIIASGLLPKSEIILLTKDRGKISLSESYAQVPILSYAHGRLPDGRRIAHNVYVPFPERFSGKRVLLVDDVVAEGETAIGLAQAFRDFRAARVDVAVVLSKVMQGGSERIQGSGSVERFVEGARIVAVRGPGQGTLVVEVSSIEK